MTRTAPGDLWTLGRHRLVVGDATNPGHIGLLLSGQPAPQIMITDPPYGVNYDPGWRREEGLGGTKDEGIIGDHKADWTGAFLNFAGHVAYVWHASAYIGVVRYALYLAGFEVRAQIIWNKRYPTIGRGGYSCQHEPCWYAVRRGFAADFSARRGESTVWTVDRERETVHPTQKPIALYQRALCNHATLRTIYDPFVGSGTVYAAAESVNGQAYGMEVDPRFADEAIARWERLTGQRAEKG